MNKRIEVGKTENGLEDVEKKKRGRSWSNVEAESENGCGKEEHNRLGEGGG